MVLGGSAERSHSGKFKTGERRFAHWEKASSKV